MILVRDGIITGLIAKDLSYIKHIIDRTKDTNTKVTFLSFCGRSLKRSKFYYIDVDHAIITIEANDRLLVCKDCIEAVKRRLNETRI